MIDVLNNAVEAVVDRCFMRGVPLVDLQLMTQATARRTKSHMVDNGCCTATRSGAGTGKKIITATGESGVDIEMRMYINAAGKNIASRSVNHFARGGRRNLRVQLTNNAALNQQVLFCLSVGVNDNAIFNQYTHSTLQKSPGKPGETDGSLFRCQPGQWNGSVHRGAGHQM